MSRLTHKQNPVFKVFVVAPPASLTVCAVGLASIVKTMFSYFLSLLHKLSSLVSHNITQREHHVFSALVTQIRTSRDVRSVATSTTYDVYSRRQV